MLSPCGKVLTANLSLNLSLVISPQNIFLCQDFIALCNNLHDSYGGVCITASLNPRSLVCHSCFTTQAFPAFPCCPFCGLCTLWTLTGARTCKRFGGSFVRAELSKTPWFVFQALGVWSAVQKCTP